MPRSAKQKKRGRKPIFTNPRSVNFTVEGETYDRLLEVEQVTQLNRSVILRSALDEFLEKRSLRFVW